MFKFIFRRRFTYFDAVAFTAIGIAATHSLGWLLLVLPTVFISAAGEIIFKPKK